MKIIFLIVFGFLATVSYAQKNILITLNDTSLKKLALAPDSILKNSVGNIEAKITLDMDGQTFDHFVIIKNFKQDTLIAMPEWLEKYKILAISIKVNFDKYIQVVTYKKHFVDTNDKYHPIKFNENIVKKYFDTSKIEGEEVTIAWYNNRGALASIEPIEGDSFYYETKSEEPEFCTINSNPKGINADVYCLARKTWEDRYHFPSPPTSGTITKDMINKLFYCRIGNCSSGDIQINKSDRTYILVFDHRGIYTTTSINPSKVGRDFSYPIK